MHPSTSYEYCKPFQTLRNLNDIKKKNSGRDVTSTAVQKMCAKYVCQAEKAFSHVKREHNSSSRTPAPSLLRFFVDQSKVRDTTTNTYLIGSS